MNKKNRFSELSYVTLTILLLSNTSQIHAEQQIVMTAQEVSVLFRVDSAEVIQMAIDHEIPARKFGREWRFNRTAVMAWLSGKDPVSTAMMAIKKTHNNPSNVSIDLLVQSELDRTIGKGMTEPSQKKTSEKEKPDTIGEKSQTKTADEVFLRDQAVLLKPKQITLELGLQYARNERNELLPFQNTAFDTSVVQGESKGDSFSSIFSVRYGLWDNLQAFASIPLTHQSQTLSAGSRELNNQSSTRWGSLTAGLRYSALAEGSGYPGVIVSVDGNIPTDERAFGVGGSISVTKSFDPAVLFFNFGYRHFFNSQDFDPVKLSAENQFNATAGIAYALNDTLTLSTSISGVFLNKTHLRDDLILPAKESYSLQFGLTSYLAKGLYVEPFVSFGLNGTGSDVSIGLNLPYTF